MLVTDVGDSWCWGPIWMNNEIERDGLTVIMTLWTQGEDNRIMERF